MTAARTTARKPAARKAPARRPSAASTPAVLFWRRWPSLSLIALGAGGALFTEHRAVTVPVVTSTVRSFAAVLGVSL